MTYLDRTPLFFIKGLPQTDQHLKESFNNKNNIKRTPYRWGDHLCCRLAVSIPTVFEWSIVENWALESWSWYRGNAIVDLSPFKITMLYRSRIITNPYPKKKTINSFSVHAQSTKLQREVNLYLNKNDPNIGRGKRFRIVCYQLWDQMDGKFGRRQSSDTKPNKR